MHYDLVIFGNYTKDTIVSAAGTRLVDGVRHYDFHRVIYFWLGSSVVSLLLAAALWRARVRD